MGTFDDAKVHEWLQGIIENAWVSLHYESPGLLSLGRGEIGGGGYARQQGSFSTPVNRTTWNLAGVRFSGLLQNRITHFGIWDYNHHGTLVAYGELPLPVVVLTGGGYLINEGQLALSIA